MFNKSNVKLNIPLPFLPLFFCQTIIRFHLVHLDRVKCVVALSPIGLWISVAVVTKIEIRANAAMMTNSGRYLTSACKALLDKLGRLFILEMPQYHHRGMLGSPQFIKLIMVSTAKIQEGLTSVEELAIDFLRVIIQYYNWTAKAVDLLLVCTHTNLITIGITFLARLSILRLDIFEHLQFSVLRDLGRNNEVFRLGIFAIQKGNDETLLHPRDGITEFLHHGISATVHVALLSNQTGTIRCITGFLAFR
mmetsp:Transcript_10836/g.19689  ORF Transcript_10836/g.19689 Transcript_10836/m.19689 type:complete len:250 (-) Transcript_10836:1941-2690(-)